ncbi:MAG: cellulase family glycosylhydrolase [Sandaracinaceae bacterium]|nr:cellulase family glycosylhydrolase [Sandaracinaceae bacterium]
MTGRRGLVAALAVSLVACAEPGPACEPARPPPSIGVDAQGRFLSDAGPFVPRAVNSYPLLDHAGWERWDAVAEILDLARDLGRPVVRTGAYMSGGENPARLRDADGTIREEGLVALDRVMAMAAERGVQLLLITANHWGDYGGAPAVLRAVAPGEALPVEAFYTDPRVIEDQRAFVATLVGRRNTVTGVEYARDPTVFAWELVNEARCDDAERCDEGTLARWADTVATAIRDAGATQPIAWGGQGYAGEHGEDLARIAALDSIDVLTLHLYPDLAGALTLEPGAGRDRVTGAVAQGLDALERAAAVARAHRRALLLEEAGWRADGPSRDAERAIVLGAWARAARELDVGFAPWMIAERDRPDYDGYLIRPEAEPATDRVLRCE